jgi:hypothetical protein
MQRIDYTKGSLVPYVEAFDKLFNDNLIASNAETLDALFPTVEMDYSRAVKRQSCVSIGCSSL